jgi:hypothetical protein
MKAREDMVFELAQDRLHNASKGELQDNYLQHRTREDLEKVYLNDYIKYYAMLEDDDLTDRYEEYIA